MKKFIFFIALILMLLNVTWANAQCPDLTIDSETVTQPACPGDTGTINFTASCTTCTGSLEYILQDVTNSVNIPLTGFQTNGVFTGLPPGDYRPVVADPLSGGTCLSLGSTITINASPPDTTPPTITCPADQTQTVGAGCVGSLANYTTSATTSDNCGVASVTQSPAGGTSFLGETTINVTLTVTDTSGNTNTCVFDVNTIDNTIPSIVTPASDLTVECDGAGNTVALFNWLNNQGGAVATDNCGITWSNDFAGVSNDCGATGSVTVTFTATDSAAIPNTVDTTATFTIEDTTDPTIDTAASDLTVECDGTPDPAGVFAAWLAINGGAAASDDCGSVTWSNNSMGLSDLCGATGTETVTFTATDECWTTTNTTSATFTIVDTTAPVITAPADVTALECGGDTTPLSTGTATATDACDAAPVITFADTTVAGCGNTEVITRTWTATDDCGNASTAAVQTITVVDTTAPSMDTDASDLTVECDGAGNTATLFNWLNNQGGAVATDNCGGVTWTNNYGGLSNDCGATGSATVTFTATDDCLNTTDTTATFTIEDTTDPSMDTDASDLTVECDGAGNTAELNAWLASNGGAVATDVCGGVTWSNDFTALSDDCGATGSATVTFTATDDCLNTTDTTATFTIEDTTDPSMDTDASDSTVECDGAGNTAELNAWLASNGGAVATDVCGGVTWSNDFTALSDDCGATGSATVTFTATDDCLNTTDTTATFTIEDTTDPSMDTDASDLTVECDGAGNTAELNAWLASNGGAVATDVCSTTVRS